MYNSLAISSQYPCHFGKLASSLSTVVSQPPDAQRRRRSSSVKVQAIRQTAATPTHVGATSGLTARSYTSHLQPVSDPPSVADNPSMSLSRSPSPRAGGGWSSPGLTSPFDTLSGRSSPRKAYGDLHISNGGTIDNGVTWASAKAKSEEVNGYPSFSTRNNGFFSRSARKISSSLPRFHMGGRQNHAEKEKLGRGRLYPNGGSRLVRLKTLLGSVTRRMRLRILIVFGIILAFILFYVTRKLLPNSLPLKCLSSNSHASIVSAKFLSWWRQQICRRPGSKSRRRCNGMERSQGVGDRKR